MLRASRASIPPPPKRAGHSGPRIHPTNQQRQSLRKWWNDNSYGKRKHEDARAWWKAQYHTEIHRSTLSDILSKKWAHLDEIELSKHQVTVQKNRLPAWSTL